MCKTNHVQTALKQRISLIIFGLFLTLVILETGLRLGGFFLLSMQERRNRIAVKQKGAYRILCLGESTTAGQYPSFLEEFLNSQNISIKFSVIDKGVIGTNSLVILNRLSSELDEYKPDMVITMMGINDRGIYVPYKNGSVSKIKLFIRSFRAYKLARLLWLHIASKVREVSFRPNFLKVGLKQASAAQLNSAVREETFKKAIELNPNKDREYVELGWFYKDQGKNSQAEEAFKKAIELNPNNDEAYVGLGWFYKDQGKFSQAEEAFKKALELNPNSDGVYVGLGCDYKNRGKFLQAEEAFKKAIKLNPDSYSAYIELGYNYIYQGKLSQAEEAFKKAIELRPNNDGVYIELGRFFYGQGKVSQAEEAFKKAIELNPNNDRVYIELGWFFYMGKGKLYQSEEIFKKAIELKPLNDRAYAALSLINKFLGNAELTKAYEIKANEIRDNYYDPKFVNNYRRVKEILDKRGIKFVCMQYPMRSIKPLKKIFEDQTGIIFVDNEKIFKEAVNKGGYREYFSDNFAGDFGHCTATGNSLLAKNIANVILKEAFNK